MATGSDIQIKGLPPAIGERSRPRRLPGLPCRLATLKFIGSRGAVVQAFKNATRVIAGEGAQHILQVMTGELLQCLAPLIYLSANRSAQRSRQGQNAQAGKRLVVPTA